MESTARPKLLISLLQASLGHAWMDDISDLLSQSLRLHQARRFDCA